MAAAQSHREGTRHRDRVVRQRPARRRPTQRSVGRPHRSPPRRAARRSRAGPDGCRRRSPSRPAPDRRSAGHDRRAVIRRRRPRRPCSNARVAASTTRHHRLSPCRATGRVVDDAARTSRAGSRGRSKPTTSLPTRPATDIALRYARLRNPANPPTRRHAELPSRHPSGRAQPIELGTTARRLGHPAPRPARRPAARGGSRSRPSNSRPSRAAHRRPKSPNRSPPVAQPSRRRPARAPGRRLARPPAPIGLPDPNSRTAVAGPSGRRRCPRSIGALPPRPTTRRDRAPGRARTSSRSTTTGPIARHGHAQRFAQPYAAALGPQHEPARTPLDWKPQRVDTAPMGARRCRPNPTRDRRSPERAVPDVAARMAGVRRELRRLTARFVGVRHPSTGVVHHAQFCPGQPKVSSLLAASTLTVSPSAYLPSRISIANLSAMWCWIARLIGRAPKAGS